MVNNSIRLSPFAELLLIYIHDFKIFIMNHQSQWQILSIITMVNQGESFMILFSRLIN